MLSAAQCGYTMTRSVHLWLLYDRHLPDYIYRVGQKNRTVFRSLLLPYMLT